MSIDKQKLQKLLWAEAASYRADCADWKRNTEALQEFLGEKTVEEVALDLLAENERLTAFEEAYAMACNVRNRLIKENDALRKAIADVDGALEREYWSEYSGLEETRAVLDDAMGKAVQP
ncbi:hypothetical protein PS896_03937 [Pseudomonas fluorescens]|uniref:Ead/Ea22-like family protein n=1 Tax=Pseudomonas fluorescens TaxID=294 RepID=A0A5E7MDS7_PSEFL|nr:hypothetical protein [Pseudomonas fluorescens]VVP22914.1 hypothetical protein PS896_03937 [Pseudomonas fluorescens]